MRGGPVFAVFSRAFGGSGLGGRRAEPCWPSSERDENLERTWSPSLSPIAKRPRYAIARDFADVQGGPSDRGKVRPRKEPNSARAKQLLPKIRFLPIFGALAGGQSGGPSEERHRLGSAGGEICTVGRLRRTLILTPGGFMMESEFSCRPGTMRVAKLVLRDLQFWKERGSST